MRIVVSLSPIANDHADPPTVSVMLVYGPTSGGVDPDATSTGQLPAFNVGDDTMARGRAMMSFLQSSPSVKSALSIVLGNDDTDADPVPIYFQTSGAIDALPWEQLFDSADGLYCALDSRWPIARMARSGSGTESSLHFFSPPFRVVAVIAAGLTTPAGAIYPGVRQLEIIASAVGTLDGAQLHVISGHDDVLARAEALANKGARISAERIEVSGQAVAAQITKANPHVLHVFSHGTQVNNTRLLNLADSNDAAANEDGGSINLPVAVLAKALSACRPWLVVLAACETGAQLSPEDPAFARALVTGGVPAVIGMRRRVDVVVMHRVVRELYSAICERASKLLSTGTPQQVETLDWSPALTGARIANMTPSPEANDKWSDPVLYANVSPLQVMVTTQTNADADAYAGGERDEWQRFRNQLSPGAPAAVVAAAEEKISRLDKRVVVS
jgi:hypothetical protein